MRIENLDRRVFPGVLNTGIGMPALDSEDTTRQQKLGSLRYNVCLATRMHERAVKCTTGFAERSVLVFSS
eukprot:scaffold468466_cov15-Prasinocladus_malaysianus.AAC.1